MSGAPDAPALVTADTTLSYADLRTAVAQRRAEFGHERRLVLLEAANDLPSVVTLLAALDGGHAVLLLAPGDLDRATAVVGRYAATGTRGPGGTLLGDVRAEALHPDLALLLSTSGSTGSPKLVRLSHANLTANAASIASYLGIQPGDRAITSLPLHYCYGLSVLTSHLAAGAAVVLTDLSVADECFWDLAGREEVTSFAGVPYTFDLLDATGFADRDLPHLRHVTQAGGRMAPDTVRRYAELGRERGWDLVVMYGQTEATARMAYLPPDLTLAHPHSIGVPIPGGDFRLAPVPGMTTGAGHDAVGELVYTGPNVMMGYAESVADLARGAEVTELYTGDLARQLPDGLWEIIGRRNRCAKVFGLRLDLEQLECELARQNQPARLVAIGDALHAFLDRPRQAAHVRDRIAALTTLPPGAVRTHALAELPMTPSGKCDYACLARQAAAVEHVTDGDAASLLEVYAVALGRPDATPADTFVGLGGDSLSYVEVSAHLARRLGHLPTDWPTRSIASLSASRRRTCRFTMPVESTVALRAVAILLILLSHTDIWLILGGAHVLLAVAGYNLARFALQAPSRMARCRRIMTATAAVAMPSALWILGVSLTTGEYRPATALFLNNLVGSRDWDANWQFWFLDVLVWGCLGLAALLGVPALDRAQRRRPFGVALTVVGATLLLRFLTVGIEAVGTEKYAILPNLWLLAVGWAAAEARSRDDRLLLASLSVVGMAGFFGDAQREAIVVAAIVVLLWTQRLLVPRFLGRAMATVASASLWIYLTHWQVYPGLEAAGHPWLGVLASVGVGVLAAAAYRRVGWVARLASQAWGRSGSASRDGATRAGGATSTRSASRSVPSSPTPQST